MISCRTDRRSPGAEFRPLADNRNGTEEERSRKNAPIMQEREGGEVLSITIIYCPNWLNQHPSISRSYTQR